METTENTDDCETTGFLRHSLLMFLALRAGDAVSLAAGMWFVPRYVSPEDIGAVLPVTSFATFLSLPAFALAMAVMKESALLCARGERGRVKSLLGGVFAAVAAALVLVLAVAAITVPRYLGLMRVSDASVGFLVVAAAFLGCVAPVYTDALQSLRKFRSLAAVEVTGSFIRFATMLVVMPARALAGYFAGQAALPAFRIVGSILALRRAFAVRAEPYWNRGSVRRLALAFVAILAYQGIPMAAALVEQTVLRTSLSSADSAGYYMASRFSDFLSYLTFPLLLVMFPYTATAAARQRSTSPFVAKCSAAALAAAALMSAAYVFFGPELLSLMPHGSDYAQYAVYMPWLTVAGALTACQVFYTNAEVSAGRFGFLKWLAPLHVVYPAALVAAARLGLVRDMPTFAACLVAVSVARFAFSAAAVARDMRRRLEDRKRDAS